MSLRAELLRLSMKAWKLSKSKRHISMAKARSRLRLIELNVILHLRGRLKLPRIHREYAIWKIGRCRIGHF